MSKLEIGKRVIVNKGHFPNGEIIDSINDMVTGHPVMFAVKCDSELPDEYAWNTNTALFHPEDLKLETTK